MGGAPPFTTGQTEGMWTEMERSAMGKREPPLSNAIFLIVSGKLDWLDIN